MRTNKVKSWPTRDVCFPLAVSQIEPFGPLRLRNRKRQNKRALAWENRDHRRAFTVTEMLFVLAIMGVASLLATRLFTGSMRVIRTAPVAQDHFSAVDRVTASLRRDVWSASAIESHDAHSLLLTEPEHATVRWQFEPSGVVRSASDVDQRWPLDVALSIECKGQTVTLKSPDGDELRFISQLIAGNGARP